MSLGDRSPRSKVKFMCSFGGKILPRPNDGVLKYVGGETRVVAVSPDISFSELTKKLTEITENEMVLKYQISSEDLDVLVSVKSDEDLKHMMDEYNRHETPKLRTFLFPPSNHIILQENNNQFGLNEPQSMEQRYIEAINGITRGAAPTKSRATPIKTRPSFTVSSSSSPKSELSPDEYSHELPDLSFQNNNNYQLSRLYPMHRVKSSPSISQPHNYHQNAYIQPPNYLTCRLRPPTQPPLDVPRGSGWDPQQSSGSKYGWNDERRFWGRASSVPQSPRKHGLRL